MSLGPKYDVVDSFSLFEASELEVSIVRLPSGEEAIVFEDCTGLPPVIYKWALNMALDWLETKEVLK